MDAQFGLLVGLLNDKFQDKTLTIVHAPGGVGRRKGASNRFPEVNKAKQRPTDALPNTRSTHAGRHLRSHTANMLSTPGP